MQMQFFKAIVLQFFLDNKDIDLYIKAFHFDLLKRKCLKKTEILCFFT